MTYALPTAADVIALHDGLMAGAGWPADAPSPRDDALWRWMQTNHRFNCRLWAEEDLARRTTVGSADIAANKRAIDGFNQARNDATERVDELLLTALGLVDADTARTDAPVSTVAAGARLNSETAGSIIDRMSILALKVHAMRAQTLRCDVKATHVDVSRMRLERLLQQRADLGACLDDLLVGARAGQTFFKVYRQFKMYNDPRFNPALVAEQTQQAGSAREAPPNADGDVGKAVTQ